MAIRHKILVSPEFHREHLHCSTSETDSKFVFLNNLIAYSHTKTNLKPYMKRKGKLKLLIQRNENMED